MEPVEEGKTEFFLDDKCYGPKNCVMDSSWRKDAKKLNLASVGQKFYGFGEGYELVLPANGAKISTPPDGHIVVFVSQLDLGLRFPLDPTLEKVFHAFNICISLLHLTSLHTLIFLLWFLLFRRYLESLHLFKSLMSLKRSAFGTESGWYYVAPKEGRVLSYPKLGRFRDWTGKFFWVKVPSTFAAPRNFREIHTNMVGVTVSPSESARETEAFDALQEAGTGDSKFPKIWLPDSIYIVGNEQLSAMHLCYAHEFGKFLSFLHFLFSFSSHSLVLMLFYFLIFSFWTSAYLGWLIIGRTL